MDKRLLNRYEVAIYLLLIFLAAILGFVGNYLISQETAKAITINLASDLLGVGILFFILNRLFQLGDRGDAPSFANIKEQIGITRKMVMRQGNQFGGTLNLMASEIEKLKDSSGKNSIILEAIKAESTLADRIQERIEINERLKILSSQLQKTEFMLAEKERELKETSGRLESKLAEKEREQKETSERLIERVLALTEQVRKLEATVTSNYEDIGRELKVKHEDLIGGLRDVMSSENTMSLISLQVNRNLPALPENSMFETLSKNIVGTVSEEVSGAFDERSKELLDSLDEAASRGRTQLVEEFSKIRQQLQELRREV